MGPTLIFDKSFLESLNPDEAMWLDNFFLSNITPLFFVETLANLEKRTRSGRTPEDIVGSIAYKTPDMGSRPNVHHATLLAGELSMGAKVEMDTGRPIISGGITHELDGKMGIMFQQSPEEEAFARWQKGQFLDLERSYAKAWRKDLTISSLEEKYQYFQKFFPLGKPKDLNGIKRFVEFYLTNSDHEKLLLFGLSILDVPSASQELTLKRWRDSGKAPVKDFAPFFYYVVSVNFFFYLAIATDLIGRGRPSHVIDLAYLYYLPFCHVFVSNDKLHADLVPFFLRDDQMFISGSELKADLANLDRHYDALPDDVKQRGVSSFAFYPPSDDTFLVSSLWDKYMSPTWRKDRINLSPQPENESSNKILEEMRRFEKEGVPVADDGQISSDQAHHIAIERKVRTKKGKWMRFPPEVIDRRKNDRGEWEDIQPK
ncbi:MAG: hypothetical protein ABIO72_00165 [Patescibacteria group bacterium]